MSARAGILALALGVSTAFAVTTVGIALARPAAMDAVALYAGARVVATGQGASLLDDAAILRAESEAAPERTALLPFVQPPAVALILAPLGLLPFAIAYPLMVAIEAAVLAAAVALLAPGARQRPTLLVLIALLAPPSAVALAEAQTSPVALLLVAIAARAGPRTAGLALGATLLRPQLAPLLLFAGALDPARRVWMALGAFAVVAASAAVVGVDGLARYGGRLVGALSWSASGELGLRSAIGWAGPAVALGSGELGLVLSLASLVAGAIAVRRSIGADRLVAASAWAIVASPHALLHDGVLALPALLRERPTAVLAATLGWIVHAAVAPVGVAVSLALALRARRPNADGRLGRP